MTPMQMLKNNFDEFKGLVPEFKELTLNKSDPKFFVNHFCGETEVHENRGVKSDFIKIFKVKYNKENQRSVGFEFKYINLNEEDFRVKVSVKEGEENLFFGEFLSVTDFKEKFVKVITELKFSGCLNDKDVVNKFKAEFNLTPNLLTKKQKTEAYKRKNKV